MALRRCATQGCTGTLPAGVGAHCPRCGGSKFIGKSRKGPGIALFLVLLAGGLITTMFLVKHESNSSRPSSPERQALVESRDIAAKMTTTDKRDAAYAEILHRALAQNDFEYACTLGGEMTNTAKKDSCLLETVQAALAAQSSDMATRAADLISQASIRDEALKLIMDSKSVGGGTTESRFPTTLPAGGVFTTQPAY